MSKNIFVKLKFLYSNNDEIDQMEINVLIKNENF